MCVDAQWINCISPCHSHLKPKDAFLSGQKTGFEDAII